MQILAHKVKLKLFCLPRVDLIIMLGHHSEYLIFMKSEFLLWHRTNWIAVTRTVYAEY